MRRVARRLDDGRAMTLLEQGDTSATCTCSTRSRICRQRVREDIKVSGRKVTDIRRVGHRSTACSTSSRFDDRGRDPPRCRRAIRSSSTACHLVQGLVGRNDPRELGDDSARIALCRARYRLLRKAQPQQPPRWQHLTDRHPHVGGITAACDDYGRLRSAPARPSDRVLRHALVGVSTASRSTGIGVASQARTFAGANDHRTDGGRSGLKPSRIMRRRSRKPRSGPVTTATNGMPASSA